MDGTIRKHSKVLYIICMHAYIYNYIIVCVPACVYMCIYVNRKKGVVGIIYIDLKFFFV